MAGTWWGNQSKDAAAPEHLPPDWVFVLDPAQWMEQHVAAHLNVDTMSLRLLSGEWPDVGPTASGQVTVVCERTRGVGKDRIFHWEVTVCDPAEHNVLHGMNTDSGQKDKSLTDELGEEMSRRSKRRVLPAAPPPPPGRSNGPNEVHDHDSASGAAEELRAVLTRRRVPTEGGIVTPPDSPPLGYRATQEDTADGDQQPGHLSRDRTKSMSEQATSELREKLLRRRPSKFVQVDEPSAAAPVAATEEPPPVTPQDQIRPRGSLDDSISSEVSPELRAALTKRRKPQGETATVPHRPHRIPSRDEDPDQPPPSPHREPEFKAALQRLKAAPAATSKGPPSPGAASPSDEPESELKAAWLRRQQKVGGSSADGASSGAA